MSNPTNKSFPSDISALRTTDYRPSKQLYANVKDNNSYRQYLQRNANQIREEQLLKFQQSMGSCKCEDNDFTIVDFGFPARHFPTLQPQYKPMCKK